MTIDEIRELDEKVFVVFQNYHQSLLKTNFSKSFPATLRTVLNFDVSATYIKNGVFDSIETDNLYSAKILFRSLIEHYLRFQFIFIKWVKSKDDILVKRYVECSKSKDALDFLKAEVSVNQIDDPNFLIDDWNELIRDNFPEIILTKSEIENEASKVTSKNIVRFLVDELKGQHSGAPSFLKSVITEYAKLSSYVHGSELSYTDLLRFNNPAKRNTEYQRIAWLTFQLSATIKLFGFSAVRYTDGEVFEKPCVLIDYFIRKVD